MHKLEEIAQTVYLFTCRYFKNKSSKHAFGVNDYEIGLEILLSSIASF